MDYSMNILERNESAGVDYWTTCDTQVLFVTSTWTTHTLQCQPPRTTQYVSIANDIIDPQYSMLGFCEAVIIGYQAIGTSKHSYQFLFILIIVYLKYVL